LDWGVVNFVTLSDGEVVEQCQPLKKFLPKLAKLQRGMDRKEKFSKNWRKAKGKIAKLHSKIANIRKDFVHKVSNDISKNHVVVCIEDLQVKNMSKSATKKVAQKSGLNRSILDAISRESQVASKICMPRMRVLGQCGFRCCCKYQRGGSRLASLFATFG
jgi:putative transposase